MNDPFPARRVALFSDSYHEANGIARLTRALEAVAKRRGLPFLCIHGGHATTSIDDGSTRRLELRRGACAFRLEHDLAFDPLMWRYYRAVEAELRAFRPDIVHITGPSDVGQLGALLGHRMSIPIVGSWHTNLHQYASLRSQRFLRWLPAGPRTRLLATIEREALSATVLFYKIPRVLLAPNPELVEMLRQRTGKPTYLMKHGVDTDLFSPRPHADDGVVRIGFVGRLSAEKRVHLLAALDRAIRQAGDIRARFIIVGDGAERPVLEREMPDAEWRGVLVGDELARVYASLDLLAFPSCSETFGLVVLEAMASGVAVLAMAHGGPRYVIEHGVSGWLAEDEHDFVGSGVRLVRDAILRRRLAAAARDVALTWSWDAVTQELYGVYDATARRD